MHKSILLFVVIAAFGALTAIALFDVGYWGIVAPHFRSWGAGQVLADLTILALLSCAWMLGDSKVSGVPAWPFILVTLVAGSFGVLFYLTAREWRTRNR